MKLTFVIPGLEPHFQGVVYRTMQDGEVYRVMIDREGAEMRYKGIVYAVSDFMDINKIDGWVSEQVAGLEKDGKTVEYDANFHYLLEKALEELAR